MNKKLIGIVGVSVLGVATLATVIIKKRSGNKVELSDEAKKVIKEIDDSLAAIDKSNVDFDNLTLTTYESVFENAGLEISLDDDGLMVINDPNNQYQKQIKQYYKLRKAVIKQNVKR